MSRLWRVTRLAQRDIDDIADHTMESWGEVQAERYLRDMEKNFDVVADNPSVGRPRDDMMQGLRSYLSAEHVIYYIARARQIEIIAVLHQAQDQHGMIKVRT